MRRLGVLLVLLAVMLGVSAIKAGSAGVGDPMTLAAIGFVLLAAFTIAQIGSALSLPRVTGYIVAGAVLGPSVANILSRPVVVEMQMFNTLALGLIATAAGLELDAKQIFRLWRTLTVTVLVKLLLGVFLVGGVLFAVETGFHSLGLPNRNAILGVALVFGMLSLGTSPAIALAVTSELRSRGRLSELVLGAAVLKDLVVVVGLAVVLAVSQPLLGDRIGTGGDMIGNVARELGLSILVGAVLGVGLILYLRYIRAEMLLFVAAMILVTAEATLQWHLELLLVFIAAGFVVRNFSRFERELMTPVQMVALPVFVVFFTYAGASIDFSGVWAVLPLALGLAAARAVTYMAGAWIGGRAGGESELVTRGAWLAYLPQAGVTLGLVRLAAEKLPSVSDQVLTLGMAVVAINLLVGPVTLRLVLRRAGEVTSEQPSSDDGLRSSSTPSEDAQAVRVAAALERIEDRRARALATKVATDLEGLGDRLIGEHLGPWATSLRAELAQLGRGDHGVDVERLSLWASRDASSLPTDRADATGDLFRRARGRLRRLPESASLAFSEHHWRPQSEDGIALAWKKRSLRWRLWLNRHQRRRVPVMTTARVALEGRLARACLVIVREWDTTEACVLADLERLALGELASGEAIERVGERLERLEHLARSEFERALARGFSEFARLVSDIGTPLAPASQIRYSRTEAEVRACLSDLTTEAAAWTRALAGARHAVHVAARLAAVRRATQDELAASIVAPMTSAVESSAAVLLGVHGALEELGRELAREAPQGEQHAAMIARVQGAFSAAVWQTLERDAARFRSGVSTHVLALELREAMEGLPEQMLLGDARVLAMGSVPDAVGLASVRVAATFNDLLLHELLPGIDEEVRRTAGTMVNLTRRLREAEEIASFAFDQTDGDSLTADAGLRDALARATLKLEEQTVALQTSAESARRGMQEHLDRVFESLATALLEPARAAEARHRRALLLRLRRGLGRAHQVALGFWKTLDRAARRIGRSDVSRELLSLYRKSNLDAVTLRGHVRRHTDHADLPSAYLKLFALEPLAGPRLFTAYRSDLDRLVAAERAWLDGSPSSSLIVGAHGSGRSSMLNQCKLELSAPRMLRLETLQWKRELGLLGALAVTLGVRATTGPLVRALSTTKTTVLVDDLEQWLTPDLHGLAELERFLDIVVRTSENAFWIVSAESGACALFEEVMPVSYAFGTTVRLEALGVEQIREALEVRHGLSGYVLRYEPAPFSAVRNRLPGLADQEVVWKVLAGLSEGNLARAISLYLRGITLKEGGELEFGVRRLLHATLPVAGWLPPRDQALLTQLLRFGPLKTSQLAAVLGLPRPDVLRQLGFLRAIGLVVGGAVDRDPARVPADLRPVIAQGLRVFRVKS